MVERVEDSYRILQFGPNESNSLPTWHPQCLAALSYAKFINLNPIVENCDNPDVSSEQILPMLAIPNARQFISGYKEIVEYLSKNKADLDSQFSDSEKKQISDMKHMIETKLHHCVWYDWCLEPDNFQVIGGLYTKRVPFPVNLQACYRLKSTITSQLSSIYSVDTMGETVFQDTVVCYRTLSNLLEDKQYLFGDKPSSADAFAFGYLACHLYSDLPPSRVHAAIAKHHNLVRYCENILQSWFEGEWLTKAKNSTSKHKTPGHHAQSVRNAFFVGGSLAMMAAYTVWQYRSQ